jgi:hypothetical protein
MRRAKSLLPDLQGPLIEGASPTVVARSLKEIAEGVKTLGHGRVGGAQALLPNLERPLVQGPGTGEIPQTVVENEAHAVKALGHGRVGGAQALLPNLKGAFVERPGRGVIPGEIEEIPEAIQGGGDL